MKKIELDEIALNAWSNALLCNCGDDKDKFDIHRICLGCQQPMDFNNHYSVWNESKSWNIKFYNNQNYNANNFSGITMAVHKDCLI